MKISLVMPVYNEEKLLPYHLDLAVPYLDEIIIVDGSPEGPSTDGTHDLLETAQKQHRNVNVIEGKFALGQPKGGWDRQKQIKAGVDKAKGEVLIIASCDCPYDDYELLCKTINDYPDGKVYYCLCREFWIDTKHVRLVDQSGYPLPLVGNVIFRRDLFTTKEPGLFVNHLVEPDEYIYLQDVHKYHYGWVTDFDRQVAKHVRNVKSGLWGEYGESILNGGEQVLDAWAITHIVNYKKDVAFPYAGNALHPFSQLEFNYLDGFDTVLSAFRKKYKKDYYDCV